MSDRLVPYTLTCAPSVVFVAVWVGIFLSGRQRRPNALALLALAIATANAALAAGTFLYPELNPPAQFLPPWKDPEILDLGLQFLTAPIGMILAAVAGTHGGPKWLMWVIEIASVPLFLVGIMAGLQV